MGDTPRHGNSCLGDTETRRGREGKMEWRNVRGDNLQEREEFWVKRRTNGMEKVKN